MQPDPADPKFPYRYALQFGKTTVDFWCLADFEDTSDSITKSGFIRQIVEKWTTLPQLVIAVGTAASVDVGRQGCVAVGCKTFMHDAFPDSPQQAARPSYWPSKQMDTIMESTFAPKLDLVSSGVFPPWITEAQLRMIPARNGEGRLRVLVDSSFVAVGDVNVGANYSQYPVKDPEALDACLRANPDAKVTSIETTSSLIRALAFPAPFIFVSGIVNDMGQLARDVNPTEYAQNFAGAHNAGVVLAAMLPAIIAQVDSE
jgi:hypothetical protein